MTDILRTLDSARVALGRLGQHDLARDMASIYVQLSRGYEANGSDNLTPTPWHCDGDEGRIYGVAPQDNGRVYVCQLLHEHTDQYDGQRCAADAALIWNAPLLRDALAALVRLVQTEYENPRNIVSGEQLAAIYALNCADGKVAR